jgi:hypothetical protein
VTFYLPHMEYEGSIGFVSRKMKKNYCWFSRFRTFYLSEKKKKKSVCHAPEPLPLNQPRLYERFGGIGFVPDFFYFTDFNFDDFFLPMFFLGWNGSFRVCSMKFHILVKSCFKNFELNLNFWHFQNRFSQV